MEKITITLVQPAIAWEDKAANLGKYSKLLDEVDQTDVIVLPEMFTTGFSMNPGTLKEPVDGPSVRWMKQMAQEKNAAVTGSLIIENRGKVFNRCVWVYPDGKTETSGKRHLFTMSGEHRHYSAGTEKTVVEFRGWRFFPLICYDLRFPVWSRNEENYDVLLFLANWPAPRHNVWKVLLQARAIENQSYVLGVNRVGKDGNGLDHLGDSACIDPKGNASFLGSRETVRSFELSMPDLRRFREKFPVLKDRDNFRLISKTTG